MAQQTKTILETMNIGTIDAKGFVDDSVRDEFFKKFRAAPEHGNRTCMDCAHRNPTWISLSHGTFVCLECSGEHRRKGVHISFVRSADMDKFTIEQMTMMAVGGNAKAREYFKKHGMGPTSELGKPINYSSNPALKYRQQIEQASHDLCKKLGAQCKSSAATVEKLQDTEAAAPDPLASNDFFNDAFTPSAPKAAAAAPVAVAKAQVASAPKAVPMSWEASATPQGPSSQVVRKAASAPLQPSVNKASPTFAGAPPKAKQAAKVIDFDFDFDEIETCANTPAPKPAPPVAKPAPPEVPQQVAPMHQSAGYPTQAKAPAPDQFAGRKALSSDDFFNDMDSASARQEKEMRYNQFSSSGAISSDAFFGREQEQQQGGGFGGFFSKVASSAGDYLDNMKGAGNSGNPLSDAIGGYMNRRT